ncbi:LutB/LldF family L-lactate oxidation iron-sulfur protein [Gleimia hominis]|uniref:LutB/LldF family L-lactate oxidation iron-sulfur protein n=1 Tax=Gleimia hominis TaxID=595468 RepID=A0ABU3I8K5_9ACTO|nr:LutB/LldF family L-lactate oxidation iron-sulfur protein [Gleimia hominis]MDT3766706.1 LutB/LldF family L-lactate oxidation iron-sulfur protein [Gleimia hominis]
MLVELLAQKHSGKKTGRAHSSEQPQAWTPGVPIPDDPLRWGEYFASSAKRQMQNTQLRRNIGHATNTIRNKRGQRVDEMPDWEQLRLAASAIKQRTQAMLPELLEQFEANVKKNGGIVHWARDGEEACRIVSGILQDKGVDDVVKVKSMATQEINLNEHLEKLGISAWETDLAEMIVQLGEDMPSHVVVPAIHRNRAEVREIFKAKMRNIPSDISAQPRELTMAARAHLRQKFLDAKVSISGANMGIAQTGTLSVFESEGNGRMCLTLPETLITVMGIEKLVPSYRDYEVFTQLLPRSATGERMNPYTSMWTGVHEGDGPKEFHLILMDNGRSRVLADEVGHEALSCIRCGACLNICPVYEEVGGHAYNSVYPGPIGISLTPQMVDGFDHSDPDSTLPFACSLCNACADACPVHIDLPGIIVENRRKYQDAGRKGIPSGWDLAMRAASQVMRSGKRMETAGNAASLGNILGGRAGKIGPLPLPVVSTWTRSHDIPVPPKQTFRSWWKEQN